MASDSLKKTFILDDIVAANIGNNKRVTVLRKRTLKKIKYENNYCEILKKIMFSNEIISFLFFI